MFDFSIFQNCIDKLLEAIPMTLEISFFSAFLGLALAIAFYLVRTHFPRTLGVAVHGITFFFRGTPLLLQLFLVYFGMGQFSDTLDDWGLWTYFREPYFCAVFTLVLNTASYSCEIISSAASALNKHDWESGISLGLSRFQTFFYIQSRKFLKVFLPAYNNEIILLLKASSLCSTITVMEIMDMTKNLLTQTYAPIEVFAASGLVYFVIIFTISRVFQLLEKKLLKIS